MKINSITSSCLPRLKNVCGYSYSLISEVAITGFCWVGGGRGDKLAMRELNGKNDHRS